MNATDGPALAAEEATKGIAIEILGSGTGTWTTSEASPSHLNAEGFWF
jgi:hypothetical protein